MNPEKTSAVDYIALGKRIRELRKSKKWSQQTLSEKCELSPTNISHIERGATKPSLDTLIKIANALETDLNTLLCDSLADAATPIFQNRISDLLDDCTDREIRLLSEFIESTKQIVRKYDKID